jgi:hypothetical protein
MAELRPYWVLLSSLVACAPGEPGGIGEDVAGDEHGTSNAVFAVDISLWSGEIADSEVRCWWDQGVRHVIAGTQNPRITRQQLDMALAGGMTVDLYIYLYWIDSMTDQVEEALAIAAEYPEVSRIWLDIEEKPTGFGVAALKAKVDEALEACGDFPCGIYTGKPFWQTYLANTTKYADAGVPLWYAWYDLNPSMSTWSTQKFGGWTQPAAKQYQETYFCGIDVDKNTMLVDAEPPDPPGPVPADGAGPPGAPTELYPDDLQPIETPSVRMIVNTVQSGVSKYAFQVESWNGTAWLPYYTFQNTKNAHRFNPVLKNRVYRFRARAFDASGWGAYSAWGEWAFGNPTKIPPPEQLDPPPGEPEPEPEPEPDPPGAPTGLTPADGSSIATPSVTLGCAAVSGATSYAFEIESLSPTTQTWGAYYTYTGTQSTRTFYPQYHDRSYRFRVRAQTNGQWSPNSNWSTFYFD